MGKIAIIDYGIGNILSVRRAFENQGAKVYLVSSREDILKATHLVLPGVGAFANGIKELDKRGLIEAIREYCEQNNPFLGICLGMQMMLDGSEEFGYHDGLGIIHGKVKRIDETDVFGNYQKVPHVGWNELFYSQETQGTLLDQIPEESKLYFVHSYTACPDSEVNRLADTFYGERRLAAVICKGNCYGTQFHPEKSGKIGLRIIKNFIDM